LNFECQASPTSDPDSIWLRIASGLNPQVVDSSVIRIWCPGSPVNSESAGATQFGFEILASDPEVGIVLQLPISGPLDVSVYNILGQRVASLYTGLMPVGRHTLTWDRRGRASGDYLIRLKTGTGLFVQRIVHLK